MNSKYKDKLVGVYAPGSYDHTSSTVGYYGTPAYARRTSENGRRLVNL